MRQFTKRISTGLMAFLVAAGTVLAPIGTTVARAEEVVSETRNAGTPNWYGGAYSTYDPYAWENKYYGQCTWYAWGRAYELTGVSLNECTGNASTWYNAAKNAGRAVGSTPRANSIAVFSTSAGYGHVAYVEAVSGDTVTLSESNNSAYGKCTTQQVSTLAEGITYYSGQHNFTTSKVQHRYSSESLIGYIYLVDEPTPGSLSISARSTYYTDEEVTVSWNTPANTASYGLTLRYNPSTGTELIDKMLTGNSTSLGKLGSGNYRLWMRPYNSSGTGGTAVYVDFTVTTRPVTKVTSVTLSNSSLSLTKGSSATLTASVAPSNATNKSVSWSSSNTSVATVSNGKVQAVGAGTATITATAADGSGKAAACTVTVTNPHTHSYTSKVTKAATCTASGVRTYTCSCGASYTETIAAKGHTAVTDSAVAATCTTEGRTAGSHCSVCGAVLKAQTVIAAKGHTAVTDSAVAATCTTEGRTAGSHCSVCGAVLQAQTVIAATGHSYDRTTLTKATTTADGAIETACSICGDTVKTVIARPSAVSVSSCTYNGKAKKPAVTLTDSNGAVIDSSNYTVTYSNNRKVGKATATIKLSGNYSGTIKKNFTIKPQGTSVTSVKAKSKGFEVKWKKQTSQTSGYEIQYSTNKKFAGKAVSTVKVGKNSTQSKKISKLKAKRTYYVRVRTYKTVKVNGKNTKIYSGWSSTKKVVTKK